MVSYVDRAIVMRSYPLGENDRIYVLYTEKHGKLSAIAKSIRKTRAHNAPNLLLFNLVQVELALGKNFDIVRSARTLHDLRAAIITDYSKFVAAGAILQLTNVFNSETRVRNQHQFDLLVAALEYFNNPVPAIRIFEIYAEHLLTLNGFELKTDDDVVTTLENILERPVDFVKQLYTLERFSRLSPSEAVK
jgi:DNA repair protein RecO (recombination protein O)